MTGGSYGIECGGCDRTITGAARYCPHCGERQPWFTDSDTDSDPGGDGR